jgi:hypothetical protein
VVQVAQGLLRRARYWYARPPGGQLRPDPGVSQSGKHPHCEQEVHPGPRWQVPQPLLHGPVLLEDVIDQLERQVLRQLAEMTGGEHPRGDGDGMGDGGSGS